MSFLPSRVIAEESATVTATRVGYVRKHRQTCPIYDHWNGLQVEFGGLNVDPADNPNLGWKEGDEIEIIIIARKKS